LNELTEGIFTDGLGFDGSSIRGWKGIEASDMLVMPDPGTTFVDPFSKYPTLSLICDIEDPLTREPYDRSPRGIAKKAEAYLKTTDAGDTCFCGPEAEFFIFDDVRFGGASNHASYSVDSNEGIWNTNKEEFPSLGYKIRHKEGYLPVAPNDKLVDIRNEMILTMMELGIEIEREHHEVATAGQAEIDIRYSSLLKCADKMCIYKYVVKNVAYRHGKTATFMPSPSSATTAPACTRTSPLESRQAHLPRRRLRRPVQKRALFHRRPPQALPRPLRHYEPDQ